MTHHLSSTPSTSDGLGLVGDALSSVPVTCLAGEMRTAGNTGQVRSKVLLQVASYSCAPLTHHKASLGTPCGRRWTLVLESQVDKGYILHTFFFAF